MKQSNSKISTSASQQTNTKPDAQQASKLLNHCRQEFFHVPTLERTTHHLTRYYCVIAGLVVFAIIVMVIDDQSFIKVIHMYQKFVLYIWSVFGIVLEVGLSAGKFLVKYLLFSDDQDGEK